MSDLIIKAKFVKETKNNHKLQLIQSEGGCVGGVYVPKNIPLPSRIIIEVQQ